MNPILQWSDEYRILSVEYRQDEEEGTYNVFFSYIPDWSDGVPVHQRHTVPNYEAAVELADTLERQSSEAIR